MIPDIISSLILTTFGFKVPSPNSIHFETKKVMLQMEIPLRHWLLDQHQPAPAVMAECHIGQLRNPAAKPVLTHALPLVRTRCCMDVLHQTCTGVSTNRTHLPQWGACA